VKLTLLPNPAQDMLTLTGLPAGNLSWEVIDARGERVQFGTGLANGGQWQLRTSSLANGAYALRVVVGQRNLTGRFVVQH
ncbi:MAG: T9SS type A sorting domain-containing protein, partial [Flavobacteriales bacterium]